MNAADTGLNLITFEDPEVEFAQTLGGTAALAVPQTLVAEPGSEPTTKNTSTKPHIYTVQAGDTVAGIAADFDVSLHTILWANGLGSRSTISVNDHLTILPTTGVLHTVKLGDTVLALAEQYDAKASDIIQYNNLDEDASLRTGQKIIIPDGYIEPPLSTPKIVPDGNRVADGPTPAPAPVSGRGLLWPTTTKSISQYFRWGHTGIDIDNQSRPPIYAANSGTIEFAGWLGGYGNLVIVNHGSGLSTYYAHLDAFYVGKGQKVGIVGLGGLGHMGLPEPAALAHDLRGPITPILASAGMLQDVLGERADEDATMLAVNIQHGAEELMLRLDYLLAIVALAQSRSSLQLASWSMGPMLKEVKNGVAREARIRRQRVVVETPEDLPRLRADKHLVRLALIGVLQWGQRHTLQGATVTICAASAGEFVEVAVRHPGKSAGGEGQGLAISLARMVAQAHDGEFSVQQRKGPSVIYTLSLPVAGPASGGQV
ncbi:MAG: LysM peptidoglycan-binding domain-containing protein [Chloroflexi bacterium]|nr:LysM peptidoglycan-binding domain-containing protein [Chloroflexota bacterium]